MVSNELPDNKLIHEGVGQNPRPFWFWLCVCFLSLFFLWGFHAWFSLKEKHRHDGQPFFQVTNRDLSVFLWQFPHLMRAHASRKSGYLSGFQYLNNVTPELQAADQIAQAPPELLFLYHTWHRQVRNEFPKRKIPPTEFLAFLKEAEEWQPRNWPAAPEGYASLIHSLSSPQIDNLQNLPETVFPLSVRLAFIGWKNYFKEGTAINALPIERKQMEAFLDTFPHYRRPYWRNIEGESYLKTLLTPSQGENAFLPPSEVPPFLKAAYYNFHAN